MATRSFTRDPITKLRSFFNQVKQANPMNKGTEVSAPVQPRPDSTPSTPQPQRVDAPRVPFYSPEGAGQSITSRAPSLSQYIAANRYGNNNAEFMQDPDGTVRQTAKRSGLTSGEQMLQGQVDTHMGSGPSYEWEQQNTPFNTAAPKAPVPVTQTPTFGGGGVKDIFSMFRRKK